MNSEFRAGHTPLGRAVRNRGRPPTLKTAIEACCMLRRIDDVVSGISAKNEGGGGGGPSMTPMDQDQAGDGQ